MILIVLISFGAVIVALGAAAAVAVIGGTALKRRAGGQQAPGGGQAPAPGPCPANPPAGRQQETPPLPPAPAPHGGKIKIVELWADGRIRSFDPRTGDTRIRPGFCPDCAAGGDWDAALRDLRRAPHDPRAVVR